jgi:murein DD-endopeptidase MepM/ murein hydrolase activator NlpD
MPDKDVPQETTTKESFRPPLESFIYSQGFSQYHWGIDLAAPEGNPVYPITKGIVLEVGQSLFGYGKYILIDHQNGYRSLYAHLQKQEVGAGDFVFSQEIGKAGHTGWASGDHLHLEVYNDGLPIDPSAIISTPLQE